MLYFKGALFFVICFVATLEVFSQTEYFEGSITYSYKEFDKNGIKRIAAVEQEKIIFSKDVILSRTISGPILSYLKDFAVYLNSDKKIRYSIFYDEKAIEDVGIAKKMETINPIEEKALPEGEILGYRCDVHFIKYAHLMKHPDKYFYDTLSCTYYNSKSLKVLKPEIFGMLQGNANSLILDGRYDGIPLKVIIKSQDGSTILIEGVEVTKMNVDEFVKLPDYTFKRPN